MNQYDTPRLFAEYAPLSRDRYGLEGAGEWHQLKPLFPELAGKTVLDLGCGYGWHCKYAANGVARSNAGRNETAYDAAGPRKEKNIRKSCCEDAHSQQPFFLMRAGARGYFVCRF